MAATSLWHIKGRLKDLVAYVENPEKTVPKEKDMQDFFNVFSYVQRPQATENGEYVSAINCLKETALQQMILTKKRFVKEDLRKLDEMTEQVRYMDKYSIETFDDLYADRRSIESEMERLIDVRRKLQNKIRRAKPEAKTALREEKAGVTARITELRKQLKLNEGIEERSLKIQEKLDRFYANEQKAKEEQQQRKRGYER